MSNFFENGKMHYRELSKLSLDADDHQMKNQQRRVFLDLYKYEVNSKYSQPSVKINTRENSPFSISSDSKTPFGSKFAERMINNHVDSNNQLNSERMSLQNSKRINKTAFPTTNCCLIFQNYLNYSSKKSKRLDIDKQEFDFDNNWSNYNCNTNLNSNPYAKLKTNRTLDSQNKYKFKSSINLCLNKDSQSLGLIDYIDEKQGALNNFELPETIQSAKKLLKLSKNVNMSSREQLQAE